MKISGPLAVFLAKESELIDDTSSYVLAAARHAILHGNSRNFQDALEALKSVGAITKTGRIAFNRKGATYRAILDAWESSKKERSNFTVFFSQHRGAPTEEMEAYAKLRALEISKKFRETFSPGK